MRKERIEHKMSNDFERGIALHGHLQSNKAKIPKHIRKLKILGEIRRLGTRSKLTELAASRSVWGPRTMTAAAKLLKSHCIPCLALLE